MFVVVHGVPQSATEGHVRSHGPPQPPPDEQACIEQPPAPTDTHCTWLEGRPKQEASWPAGGQGEGGLGVSAQASLPFGSQVHARAEVPFQAPHVAPGAQVPPGTHVVAGPGAPDSGTGAASTDDVAASTATSGGAPSGSLVRSARASVAAPTGAVPASASPSGSAAAVGASVAQAPAKRATANEMASAANVRRRLREPEYVMASRSAIDGPWCVRFDHAHA